MTKLSLLLLLSLLLIRCSVSRNYNPDKKYPRQELQHDYTLLRNILEKKHPSLYWYTPKDSMDYFFDKGYKQIEDSMTELQFGWKIIAPLTHTIHCGHTSFSMSKGWNSFIKNKRIPSFPLYMKIWKDTMVVTANLNPKDSILKKGTLITGINGMRNQTMIQGIFDYLAEDGHADNVNYIRLSSNFPYFHRNVFGIYKNYSVQYFDSVGKQKKISVPVFIPGSDSLHKKIPIGNGIKLHKATRKERLENIRSLEIDSADHLVILTLNSFSKGHLRNFFRQTFRTLKNSNLHNLAIDIRGNGGGEISNYVLLSKYIRNTPFKVADTATSVAKSLHPYARYIKNGFINSLGLTFFTGRKKDGRYHFGYWDRHTVKPKRKNHFSGNVYVLTNGLTFSASTLFCNSVKGQDNVKLVGEETGGGWYGNSGILIPDIILPNTKIKVRLPLFRLVQYHHISTKGSGVTPDIFVPPSVKDVRNNVDRKMETVKALVRAGALK